LGTIFYIRSDEPFIGDSLSNWTKPDLAAGMLNQPIEWLESGLLPRDRLYNVNYNDLVAEPVEVASHIYRYFGIPLSPEGLAAMQRYNIENPRSARPTHAYSLGSSEQITMARNAFAKYQDYFQVPSEVE
jgi:hypothetical protein